MSSRTSVKVSNVVSMLAKAPDYEVTSESRLHISTEGYDYLWAWEGHGQQLRGNKGSFSYLMLLCVGLSSLSRPFN